MDNEPYHKRELDHIFKDIKDSLDRIEEQTTRHNGRLTKVERILLILGCVTGTILVVNGSELVGFLKGII